MKKIIATAALTAALASGQAMAMSSAPETGYTETRYPIVLVHGFLGFDSVLGIEYFYKVAETLQEDGADVYTVSVSNTNFPEYRGEQLLQQVEQILALTGAEKVNLIGHSHGSPTSRYVASVRPDLVASVTGVSGVNKATPVADTLIEWSENQAVFGAAFEAAIGTLSVAVDFLSGANQELDVMDSVGSMTTPATEAFNAQHPGGIPATECGEGDYEYQGVRYYSWAGAESVTNLLDPLEFVTATFGNFFPEGVANDGFVGACAAGLGMIIRNDFAMTHLDEINQSLGIHDLNDTDPLTVFRTHANRLKNAGL
ncbi:MAG: lipase [Oceanospirillaceae bacterium]|nr:lipase [Oceanospirillaceae bacterium]MBT12319.1 lipase [Oceanospirillaceae bacterium]|tara:strand:+ start:34740 stop:35678 length:939 start_codon:yes stop_codon:yes gene_type:complete